MPLGPGTRLGPYDVQSAIGAGGMGEVDRATDTALERQVAITVLPDAFAQEADRLARFEREAKALAALNHPHICTIHDIDAVNGRRFIVMELLEGKSLRVRFSQQRAAIAVIVDLATELADAPEAAHAKGIVHSPFLERRTTSTWRSASRSLCRGGTAIPSKSLAL